MNKVSIITGGARGIGAAIAHKLGTKGYSIVIADIDENAGQYRLNYLKNSGIDAILLKLMYPQSTMFPI